jgi:hypothetical protein
LKNLSNKTLGIVFAILIIFGFIALYFVGNKGETRDLKHLPVEHLISPIAQKGKGCLLCHSGMQGFAPMHQDIGCISCHKGDGQVRDKDSSHFGMILIPGNFNDMASTCGFCHPDAVKNIQTSIMATNSGLVNIDRYIFGERESPDGFSHVKDIGHSAADSHLRNLCARCHLGMEKTETGPITELSRGGGCNACHLNFSEQAYSDFENYHNDSILPVFHASLDLQISNDHCFGCHSRSGRIATNYEGFHETQLTLQEIKGKDGYRLLQDGRVFKYIEEDVHHAKGLACIDCHNYGEVMGDGKLYMHEENAVKIRCNDCHLTDKAKTISYDSLDFIYRRILQLKNIDLANRRIMKTGIEGRPMTNAFLNEDGTPFLIGKLNGKTYPLIEPAEICTRGEAHDEITCAGCHTSWAPQCIGCHINYEPDSPGYDLLENKKGKGTWREYAGGFFAGQPTLGVTENLELKEIKPAIPGMIMTLDKSEFSEKYHGSETEFFRLFAPAEPHTISIKGRNCKTCHNSSLALGYGRGELKFNIENERSYWTFESEYESSEEDGLPQDAWIGFLEERNDMASTRIDFRPFNLEEQERILRVGACLTCHKEDSDVMLQSLDVDFKEYLEKISTACRVPEF